MALVCWAQVEYVLVSKWLHHVELRDMDDRIYDTAWPAGTGRAGGRVVSALGGLYCQICQPGVRPSLPVEVWVGRGKQLSVPLGLEEGSR